MSFERDFSVCAKLACAVWPKDFSHLLRDSVRMSLGNQN